MAQIQKNYGYPVWATQGGGLVRESGSGFVFIEKPDCLGLDVGDTMPDEWGLVPANDLASTETDEEW